MYNLKVVFSKADMDKIFRGVPQQIRNQIAPRIVKRLVKGAWASAQGYASRFQFEKTLRHNLITRIYKTEGRVEVKGGARVINEALLNEYGPSAGRFRKNKIYLSTATQKLKRWMESKGRKSVRLGGPRTSWGRNKFLEPAFVHMVNRVPQILSEEFKRLK